MSSVSGSRRCQSAKPQLKPHAGGLEFGLQIKNPPTATLLVEEAHFKSGSHEVKQGEIRVYDQS